MNFNLGMLLPGWQRREEERQGMKRYSGDARISDRSHRPTAHDLAKHYVPPVARAPAAEAPAAADPAVSFFSSSFLLSVQVLERP